MSAVTTLQTDDARALLELEAAARAEVLLPVDAHVIGEPVTVTQIRYPGLPRVGLLVTCRRGELTYELSLVDVVFSTREMRFPSGFKASAACSTCALPTRDLRREGLDGRVPEAPKLPQPCIDRGERSRVDGIEASCALGSHRREAALAQDL